MAQQEEEKLDYSLDNLNYDTVILGTGLQESLFAACLAKIGQKKVIVIDIDKQYSSSIKTMNFKEFHNWCIALENQNKNVQSIKVEPYTIVPFYNENLKSINEDFIGQTIQSQQFKQYNIDLFPAILYSSSITVEMMRQADMDKYMEFKAISKIYHFDSSLKKFIVTPSTKGDIFKHKDLSISEKKQLFQLLHTCIKLGNLATGYKVDQNSTAEFDKDFELDEQTKQLFKEYESQNCLIFLKKMVDNQKIIDLFLYTLCNYEFNPEYPLPEFVQNDYLTINFLKRLTKFIRSCGIHTSLPYLYTSYGTGDIPQGYSRIAAVFSSTYCIHPKIDIKGVEQKAEQFQIKSNLVNLNSEQQFIQCNQLICGPEYKQSILKMLNNEQQQNNKENKAQPTSKIIRLILICKKFNLITLKQQQLQKQQQQMQEQQNKQPNQIDVQVQQNIDKKVNEEGQQEIINKEQNTNLQEDGQDNLQVQQKVGEIDQATEKVDKNIIQEEVKQQEDVEVEEVVGDEEQIDETEELESAPPVLYFIPPHQQELNNQNPIQIIELDNQSHNTPQGYTLIYIKHVVQSSGDKEEDNKQYNKIIEYFVGIIPEFAKLQCSNSKWKYVLQYVKAYIQERNNQNQNVLISNNGCKLLMIDELNFEMDLDKYFEQFQSNINQFTSSINQEEKNYFQTIQQLKGEPDPSMQAEMLDEENDQDDIQSILKKFDNLKEKNTQPETNN